MPVTRPTQAQIEALELIDTFAWSCVKTDCEESRVELQRRIDKCRAALKEEEAAGRQERALAHIRVREFGNGATWVDFPITLSMPINVSEIEAATIERCAQVAETVDDGECGYQHAKHIAAAIRAMKEEP